MRVWGGGGRADFLGLNLKPFDHELIALTARPLPTSPSGCDDVYRKICRDEKESVGYCVAAAFNNLRR